MGLILKVQKELQRLLLDTKIKDFQIEVNARRYDSIKKFKQAQNRAEGSKNKGNDVWYRHRHGMTSQNVFQHGRADKTSIGEMR